MSNLGRYQEFVTDAKHFGGVDNYVRMIEANAVADAAPKLVAGGVAATVVLAGGIAGLAFRVKRYVDSRRALRTAADEARAWLWTRSRTVVGTQGADEQHRTFHPCPVCGKQTLQPYSITSMKCPVCATVVPITE